MAGVRSMVSGSGYVVGYSGDGTGVMGSTDVMVVMGNTSIKKSALF
jgi:hypothetical protein